MTSQSDTPYVDTKVLDGAAIVHMLQPAVARTFKEYADQVFVPYIHAQLHDIQRLDIVWDVYLSDSLKQGTRDNRGTGIRKRVEPKAKLPGNWQSFLRVDDNKTELFDYLGQSLMENPVDGNELYSTSRQNIHYSSDREDTSGLAPCSHEEADSRIMLHVADQVGQGYTKISVRTVDTDIVILSVATARKLMPELSELWVAFGTAKSFRYLPTHDICNALGPRRSLALPLFHAFTGCDTVSAFAGKGKQSAWDTWNVLPEMTDALAHLAHLSNNPPQDRIPDQCMCLVERFVVVMYDRASEAEKVNAARQQLFSKGSRALENIPPTQAALTQHTRRAIYQAVHC